MKHLKTIGKGIAVAVGLMLCKAMNVGAVSYTHLTLPTTPYV